MRWSKYQTHFLNITRRWYRLLAINSAEADIREIHFPHMGPWTTACLGSKNEHSKRQVKAWNATLLLLHFVALKQTLDQPKCQEKEINFFSWWNGSKTTFNGHAKWENCCCCPWNTFHLPQAIVGNTLSASALERPPRFTSNFCLFSPPQSCHAFLSPTYVCSVKDYWRAHYLFYVKVISVMEGKEPSWLR